MARLPLATLDDLIDELELIAYEREKVLAQKNVTNPEGRMNRLDSLDEWESDLRQQLAEAVPPTEGTE